MKSFQGVPVPTADEVQALRVAVLAYFGRAGESHRQFKAMQFLLDRYQEQEPGVPHMVQANDINSKSVKGDKSPASSTVANLMVRLHKKLDRYFDEDADGRSQRWRIKWRTGGNYSLVFRLNNNAANSDDLTKVFWTPYAGENTTRILYPEPKFYKDSKGTYFRNPNKDKEFFQTTYQISESEKLRPSNSFVPAGLVQAMITVYELLRSALPTESKELGVKALSKNETIPRSDSHLILLGTPTSTPMVRFLEQHMPFRSTPDGVERDGYPTRCDDKEANAKGEMQQWGLLTRCRYVDDERAVTVFSALHGRTVQGIAKFLTNKSKMTSLLKMLDRTTFPYGFQAVFRVVMTITEDGPEIVDTTVDDAIVIEEHLQTRSHMQRNG
jgi:hypothetical protein